MSRTGEIREQQQRVELGGLSFIEAREARKAIVADDVPFLLEQLSKAEQLIEGVREAVASADQFHRRVNTITRLLAGYQATGGSE